MCCSALEVVQRVVAACGCGFRHPLFGRTFEDSVIGIYRSPKGSNKNIKRDISSSCSWTIYYMTNEIHYLTKHCFCRDITTGAINTAE